MPLIFGSAYLFGSFLGTFLPIGLAIILWAYFHKEARADTANDLPVESKPATTDAGSDAQSAQTGQITG